MLGFILGLVLLALGRNDVRYLFKSASVLACNEIFSTPGSAAAQFEKSANLLYCGRLIEAIHAIKNLPPPYQIRDELEAEFNNQINIHTARWQPGVNLVLVHLFNNEYDDALARSNANLRSFPDQAWCKLLHAFVLAKKGQMHAAVGMGHEADAMLPDHPLPPVLLAIAYWELGDKALALRTLGVALLRLRLLEIMWVLNEIVRGLFNNLSVFGMVLAGGVYFWIFRRMAGIRQSLLGDIRRLI